MEPIAALHSFPTEQVKNGDILFIYDFGGGTLDVALAEKTGKGLEVIASSGIDIGGADIDSILREDIAKSMDASEEQRNSPRFKQMVYDLAIKAKHALSTMETYTAPITLDHDYIITRQRFNELILPLMRDSDGLIEKLLDTAAYSKDEVSHVMCVGGSSCIPFVVDCVVRALGKHPIPSTKPELAVCLGATVFETVKKANVVSNAKEMNIAGNSPGNIKNGGYFAQQGDWIYYADSKCIIPMSEIIAVSTESARTERAGRS
jgi:molecular chaperone DnaK (HSP70)